MSHFPQDNLIDIFLYNPCDEVYDEIIDKELALELLRKQNDSVQKLQFLHSKGDNIIKMDILKMVIEENNYDLFKEIVDGVGYKKDTDKIILHCAKHGREAMMRYIIHHFPVGFSEWSDDYELAEITREAARSGLARMVNYLIDEEGYDDYFDVAIAAAEGGHMNIVDSLAEGLGNEYYNYDAFASAAAKGGHLDIVIAMIENGADDYNNIAVSAAQNQHFTIVKEMIKRNIDDNAYNTVAYYAARYGEEELLDSMIKNRRVNYNMIVKGYARGGHRASLSSIIAKTSQDNKFYNTIAISATIGCHIDIVYDLLNGFENKSGTLVSANNYSSIAYIAAAIGESALVLDMVDRDDNIDLHRVAFIATKNNRFDIVDDMIYMGVNDDYIVNCSAVYNGRVDILRNNNVQYSKDLVSLAVENGQIEVFDYFYDLKRQYRLSGFDSVFY